MPGRDSAQSCPHQRLMLPVWWTSRPVTLPASTRARRPSSSGNDSSDRALFLCCDLSNVWPPCWTARGHCSDTGRGLLLTLPEQGSFPEKNRTLRACARPGPFVQARARWPQTPALVPTARPKGSQAQGEAVDSLGGSPHSTRLRRRPGAARAGRLRPPGSRSPPVHGVAFVPCTGGSRPSSLRTKRRSHRGSPAERSARYFPSYF